MTELEACPINRQQHIDTLARAIDPKAFLVPDYVPGTTPAMYQDAARGDAARIFDSTDPAVHDALAAALHANADRARVLAAHADAGWLTEERRSYCACCGMSSVIHTAEIRDRRFRGQWELTP